MSFADLSKALQELNTKFNDYVVESRTQHVEVAALVSQLSTKIDMLDYNTYTAKLLPTPSVKKPSKASKEKKQVELKETDPVEEPAEEPTTPVKDASFNKTRASNVKPKTSPVSEVDTQLDKQDKPNKPAAQSKRNPNKQEVFKKLFLENNPCLNAYLTDKVKQDAEAANIGWKALKKTDREKEQVKHYYKFMTANHDDALIEMKKNLIDESEKPNLVSKE